jgi:hypothetical protein
MLSKMSYFHPKQAYFCFFETYALFKAFLRLRAQNKAYFFTHSGGNVNMYEIMEHHSLPRTLQSLLHTQVQGTTPLPTIEPLRRIDPASCNQVPESFILSLCAGPGDRNITRPSHLEPFTPELFMSRTLRSSTQRTLKVTTYSDYSQPIHT